ncbi:uncharacterized protein LOC118746680 [Rhagoletis pomonella]|uniref:uncharacterized protein LOC118746680 n=1 Tax=Rhagoletis pomonella TaxID=28610 RepID=UPI00177A9EBE|nr:uncharacterized protein LOC118746680 [Rhagoletis pomonella]
MDDIAEEPDGSWAQSTNETLKRSKMDSQSNASNIYIKPLNTSQKALNITQKAINTHQKPTERIPIKYDAEHNGPFVVYIDKITEHERKPINAVAVTNTLKKNKFDEIDDVIKVGFGRVKVICKKAEVANNICNDMSLRDKGYEAKILQHCISKIGIMFDIPTEITMEELEEEIKSSIPILKLVRVERRDKEDKEIRIHTRRVKVVFKGQTIPEHIIYAYTRIQVKPFVVLSQCYRCFRYNHFAQHCKEK